MKNSRSLIGVFFCFLYSTLVFAETETTVRTNSIVPLAVNPGASGEGITTVPTTGVPTRVGTRTVTVKLINSCFGTNLRSVSNPVSPDGTIRADVVIEAGGQSQRLIVSYPGNVVAKDRNGGETPLALDTSELPAGSRATAYGPVVQVEIPVNFTASLTVEGGIQQTPDRLKLVSSSFLQIMHGCPDTPVYGPLWEPTYACGTYMGQDGPLSVNLTPAVVAPDNSSIELSAAFPGQNGFCGGFYSPLMIFFDEKRPAFTGASDFPLNAGASTAWPEAGAPGYFLALDLDGDGKISRKNELFGEDSKFKNGFEALRVHDTNGDGQISSADKKYRELILWNDKNGDGISDKSEMELLSKRVKSISLQYTDQVRPIGLHAEERQLAEATLKKPKGKIKTVTIADIWLAPRPKEKK